MPPVALPHQANLTLPADAASYDSSDGFDYSAGPEESATGGTWMQRMLGSLSGSRADSSTEEDDELVGTASRQ